MGNWSLEDTFEKTIQAFAITYDTLSDKVSQAARSGQFIDDSLQLAKDLVSGKVSEEVTDKMWARNHGSSDPDTGTQDNKVNTTGQTVTTAEQTKSGGGIIFDMIKDYMRKVASLDDDTNENTVYLYDIVKDGNVSNYVESKFPTIKDYTTLKPFAQRYKEMKIQFSFSDIVAILIYFRGKYGA